MDVIAHYLIGMLFYIFFLAKMDVLYFLIGCVILDLDHTLGFVYRKLRGKLTKKEKKNPWIKNLLYHDRSPFHSLWGALIISYVVFLFTKNVIYAESMFLGIIVHLILDSIDQEGVKWFWPFLHIKYKFEGAWRPKSLKIYKEPWFIFNTSLLAIIFLIKYFK
ncbi:metal-dependent hydrolase [Candidatus Woesearchaeota archaeon]|nr:metal-dependent hydrolase [Candidatus Woesearchaeota archaeon]